MVLWNLQDGGPSHSGPLLGLSKSMRGGTLGTNPATESTWRWRCRVDLNHLICFIKASCKLRQFTRSHISNM
jgi:hypothetical protein